MRINSNVHKLGYDNVSEKFFKKKIFNGELLIIKKSIEIKEIINYVEKYFFSIFDISITDFKKNGFQNHINENNVFFKILQNRIKNCILIKQNFSLFLEKLGLKKDLTFIDMMSLRFSPRIGKKEVGYLNPTSAHRDTWASNIFNQINLWFPIHDVKKENSIFLAPQYFKRKVKNNSSAWSFKSFKNNQNDKVSVPTAEIDLKSNEKISFDLSKGEVLCFSGHHLHGSNVGNQDRINLETRIVNSNDENKYKTPQNLDCENKVRKNKWFKNIYTGDYYR